MILAIAVAWTIGCVVLWKYSIGNMAMLLLVGLLLQGRVPSGREFAREARTHPPEQENVGFRSSQLRRTWELMQQQPPLLLLHFTVKCTVALARRYLDGVS